MTVLISALAFVLLLTLLIIIHELGHYTLAKLFGVEVEEFGFGLPPKAKTLFHKGGTDFTLNWVPFGGFVRLKGENEVDSSKRSEKGSFAGASIPARILILIGGVAMNFLLAFVLLTIGFSIGRWVPNYYTTIEELRAAAGRGEIELTEGVYITDVLSGSPAAKAGIVKDAAIVAVNKTPVSTPEEVIALQQGRSSVTYTLKEGKDAVERDVRVTLSEGKSGVAISPFAARLSAPTRSLPSAISIAAKETVFMTVQTVYGIGNLFRSLALKAHVPEGITGIVGIAVLTYSSVQEGFMTYLRLVALLSLSLAILNILPLPALDGGRLLFVLVEMVIRRPVNQRFELMTNAIGFFLLIGLIIVITFNDVWQLF
ncbi:MAG: M50 family metallopeptidase [Candidatus Peribacteraceae bacterium]